MSAAAHCLAARMRVRAGEPAASDRMRVRAGEPAASDRMRDLLDGEPAASDRMQDLLLDGEPAASDRMRALLAGEPVASDRMRALLAGEPVASILIGCGLCLGNLRVLIGRGLWLGEPAGSDWDPGLACQQDLDARPGKAASCLVTYPRPCSRSPAWRSPAQYWRLASC